MTKLVDVSHTVADGLVTYKGLPAPIVCDYLSREASQEFYEPNTSFHIGKIEMVANTGTYIDAPWHRHAEGKDLSELPLTSLAHLDGIVIRANKQNGRVIDAQHFYGHDLVGKAVLVDTGWSAYWNTDQYFEGHSFLTERAAIYLRDAGAALVGIDSLNIDDTSNTKRPVHTILLGNDILIVEHLTNLHQVPSNNFRFYAVPVKVKAMGSFPVRAFCMVPD